MARLNQAIRTLEIAEDTFSDMQPRRLSILTDRLLESIDYEACKKQRNNNFHFLHDQLKHLNNLDLHMLHIAGPMCYPLLIDDAAVREILLANRIYVPTYWPEVSGRAKRGSFDRNLLEKCLPLPCDQRYQKKDMAHIVELVKGI